MTELSFLIDLLLNHELQKQTKDAIAERIKEVEASLSARNMAGYTSSNPSTALRVNSISSVPQAQSTLDAMARHGDVSAGMTSSQGLVHPQQLPPEMPPVPVQQIAQTPATSQALNSRNQAIAASIAGKIDKVTGRPRKF